MTAAVLAVTVAAAIFIDGGFSPESRGVFAALAGLAAITAAWSEPDGVARAAKSPPVLALVAIAALTALSALWTIGEPWRALRWSLAIAGYAAVACAAAAVGGRGQGRRTLAAIIAGGALASGAAALVAVAVRASPYALHLNGEWQAAGPFEYAPALATVEVAALPILIAVAARADRERSAAAAIAGMAVAMLAIGLSSSRLGVALAAAVIAASVVGARRVLRREPLELAALWVVGAALPLLVLLVFDPADPASRLDTDAARAVMLALAALGPGAVWLAVGPRLRAWARGRRAAGGTVGRRGAPAALAVVALIAAGAVGVLAATERSGHGVERSSGFLHGRAEQWDVAIDAYGRRPVVGSGAETYFIHSARAAGDDRVLYAHDLPLELAAELGTAGLLAALGLYAAVAHAIWRRRRALPALWLFAPAVAAFLIANAVDWSWHLAGAGALWAVALGGLIATRETGYSPPD